MADPGPVHVSERADKQRKARWVRLKRLFQRRRIENWVAQADEQSEVLIIPLHMTQPEKGNG